MTKEERIQEENRKIKKLRCIVDLTSALLSQLSLSEESANQLIEATRKSVLTLFPDSEKQFDLIYMSRFGRILQERNILNAN